tara:strand:- start:230 stop:424 length:195 start_codon:yes stop_codon:yes gene_type:complete
MKGQFIGRPEELMDAIDFMSEVYVDYVVKHKLPRVSADEQDFLPAHDAWLKNFIKLWDYAQTIT